MLLAFGILLILFEIGLLFAYILLFVFKKMELSKKNNCFFIPVSVIVLFVYCISAYYVNPTTTFFEYVRIIPKAVKFLTFDVDVTLIEVICTDYPIYYVVYVFLLIFVFLSWIIAAITLFGSKIHNFYRTRCLIRKNCDIVVGVSEDSIRYVKNYENSILWIEQTNKKTLQYLKDKKIPYISKKINEKTISKKLKSKIYHLICFKDANYNYIELLSQMETLKNSNLIIHLHFEAEVEEIRFIRDKYFALSLENQQIYYSCFNKHELLAREFVKLYPISKYLPQDFICSNLTIKSDKKINVCFIGFGRVNMSLFKIMTLDFQFAQEVDGRLEVLPVNYYAFDAEEERLHNEYFSKLGFDFHNSFINSELPQIEKICNLEYKTVFAETIELKEKIKEIVHENSYTYFIISLRNDSENTGYADSLYSELEEYKNNFLIFTRVKDNKINELNNTCKNIIYFGEDRKFLNHTRVINDDLMRLAGLVNDQYRGISNLDLQKKWQKESTVEQYSNIYAALNVYHKMGLMGFELVPVSDPRPPISKEEYESVYGSTNQQFNEKQYNSYTYYFETNPKNVLAFCEHSRWNANYFLFDFKPLNSKNFVYDTIKDKVIHKDVEHKKHACLTTYSALDQLIQIEYEIIKRAKNEDTKRSLTDSDFLKLSQIYQYDYMVMDAIYNLLNEFEQKIVKK